MNRRLIYVAWGNVKCYIGLRTKSRCNILHIIQASPYDSYFNCFIAWIHNCTLASYMMERTTVSPIFLDYWPGIPASLCTIQMLIYESGKNSYQVIHNCKSDWFQSKDQILNDDEKAKFCKALKLLKKPNVMNL